MATIVIPQTLTKTERFVAVPQKAYEEFLTWQKKIRSAPTFAPTPAIKKALAQARKNLADGKYFTLEQIRHELASRR